MKAIKDMTNEELKDEIRYIVTLLDEQPGHHEAYLAELADELANRVWNSKA